MINVLEIQQPTMEENISNLTSASGEASVSSSNNRNENSSNISQQPIKKKRSQPGHPDPGAEVIALSPRTLVTTNRFVCDVCNKGFQRDQNLQLHRRGHNLPWKLKQKSNKEVRRKVYICPEIGCVHHDPSRALGDLTGIKKHFYRKHGEKKWKCEKCSKKYAVQSDWKAHSKICGTREYKCDCGTLFSRRDSFITHRAFCDALAQENVRSMPRNYSDTGIAVPLQYAQNSSQTSLQAQLDITNSLPFPIKKEHQNFILKQEIPPWLSCSPIIGPSLGPPPPIDLTTTPSLIFQDFHQNQDHFSQNHDHNPNPNPSGSLGPTTLPPYHHHLHHPPPPPHISATALLQRASQMGAKSSTQRQFPSPGDSVAFTRPYQADHVTVGFGPSSRDQLIHGLAPYADKSAPMTGGGATGCAAAPAGDNNHNTPPPSLVHQMMMINNAGFDQGPGFDDMGFGQIMNVHPSSKDHDHHRFHATVDQSENLTRDFLGLRPLSQNDILSITGLDSCINTNVNQNQTPKSWQG